ncbi:AraC family transcriptional regulator [Streptomyces sp. A1136]|uniref:helix-turn-helix domain-containing protein n=1 Tax=Streptomyces sp. A1136 TaxID=2563102 RepID=UPI00109EAD01|nr:helix-turn-helix transcriptional regulator [Streptomyces sp. A1136]THA47726.1 AraC family transcriptional regulator [Streptomyces sp. A1136]
MDREVTVIGAGGLRRVTRPLHPGLQPYLCGRTGYSHLAPPYQVRMVPTGHVILTLSLAEPFSQIRRLGMPGPGTGRIGSAVVGMEDRPAWCAHPGGRQEVIRLEFTPLGAYRLLALPMRELTNRVVELDGVLGPEAGVLVERLAAARDWGARFDLLDAVLLARLGRGPEPAPEVEHAWRLLSDSAGALPIARLADEVGWSRSYLVRRFTEQVGLTPKTSARVLRFRRAAELVARGPVDLAGIAARCGFYDQAHLTREFRSLAGLTPGRMATTTRPVDEAFAL